MFGRVETTPSGNIIALPLKRRLPDGSLQPVTIRFDKATAVIVDEIVEALPTPLDLVPPKVARTPDLQITDYDLAVAKFYNKYSPCFFPGCAELREKFKAGLNKHADCTPCEEGRLMREFEEQYLRHLPYFSKLRNAQSHCPDTGPGAAPDAAGELPA